MKIPAWEKEFRKALERLAGAAWSHRDYTIEWKAVIELAKAKPPNLK